VLLHVIEPSPPVDDAVDNVAHVERDRLGRLTDVACTSIADLAHDVDDGAVLFVQHIMRIVPADCTS
jgi:hypothetical protein